MKQALDEAIAGVRAGASGHELYRGTCELFQEHGYKTLLTKDLGETLEDGFFHGLGHGVGLEVHEDPGMGLAPASPLVAGDVVTVEPGLYRPGFGGCRLEDLVLVTEDGCENLTDVSVRPRAVTEGIETLLHEERRYAPSPEFAAQANAQPDIYDIPFEEFWARRSPRPRDVVRRLSHRPRVGGAVREVVRRRHAQRLLQLPRPARGGG